ncbi:MAG: hypothetical protein PHH85_03545 [Candidatus Methanoperedens sp.]|nr:hypothetical protein [Candidatus Methanoperedens sp.]
METLIKENTEIASILNDCGLSGCPKTANPLSRNGNVKTTSNGNRVEGAIKSNIVPTLLAVIALELAYIAWRLK